MGEVRYSVNGKYFKDYSVLISSSDGIGDGLKRKKVNTYDWAEYHGSSPDLSSPKFESREITLKGFVIGSNWEVMKSNFDAIISEFQKAGTQRLLIEPFGLKPLPYEVYMEDSTPLEKIFKDGQMVGTFTLKLIEPNPLKIVLHTTGTTLNLSYSSPNETEIFYGNGLKETAKGNVSLSGKTLANRVVSGYAFEGRNLLLNSNKLNAIGLFGATGLVRIFPSETILSTCYLFISEIQRTFEDYVFFIPKDSIQGNKKEPIVISFYVKTNNQQTISVDGLDGQSFVTGDFDKKVTFFLPDYKSNIHFRFSGSGLNSVVVYDIKIEKGNKATDWTPAPEEEKIIIIAGNVEEIANLTTNAKVLWEKL